MGRAVLTISRQKPFSRRPCPLSLFSTSHPRALEYGCGTGPGACFLACNGYDVEGIDQDATAIKLACQQAETRQLDIRFSVRDICELTCAHPRYDLIVDSYCLQSIVLDRDRQRLFEVVKSQLLPGGFLSCRHGDLASGRGVTVPIYLIPRPAYPTGRSRAAAWREKEERRMPSRSTASGIYRTVVI